MNSRLHALLICERFVAWSLFRAAAFSLLLIVSINAPMQAATLKVSANSTVRADSEVEGNCSTMHVFFNEVAAEQISFTIFFDPQVTIGQTGTPPTGGQRFYKVEVRLPGPPE